MAGDAPALQSRNSKLAVTRVKVFEVRGSAFGFRTTARIDDDTRSWRGRPPAPTPVCYGVGAMPPAASSPDLSFPKTRRLVRPAEFGRVKSEGTTHRGQTLVLGVLAEQEEKLFRVGFVTSKRIGGAVVRNRVRRRLRDIVRTQQGKLRRGFWLVVIARPAAAHASYSTLKDEWLRLAERASILAP
jgi:ribonuclease P protein component